MGIDKYNEECRSIVMRYSKARRRGFGRVRLSSRPPQEWESTVKRVGRWIDFENDYKTLDPEFMARPLWGIAAAPLTLPQESVWWVFKTLQEKGLVYRGFKARRYNAICIAV